MRLIELEIHNVRGIRDLLLKPEGTNLLIWGPNGSGKSAVVDAIDFLLTGSISRLMGPGTAGINLSSHGPHIDSEPDDAWVRAVIKLATADETIEITRRLDSPSQLDHSEEASEALKPILEIALRGQHVLTRREILRFITSEAGKRAEQIQQLLNMTDIPNVRRALNRARNSLETDMATKRSALKSAETDIQSTTQIDEFSEGAVLKVINDARAKLDGADAKELSPGVLKEGVTAPSAGPAPEDSWAEPINLTILQGHIEALHRVVADESKIRLPALHSELAAKVEEIINDPKLLHDHNRQRLLELGEQLLDETGKCPLCGAEWEAQHLKDHVAEGLESARASSKVVQELSDLASKATAEIEQVKSRLSRLVAAAKVLKAKSSLEVFSAWEVNLQQYESFLNEPVSHFPLPEQLTERISNTLAPLKTEEALEDLASSAQAHLPEKSPEQTAWDLLTEIDVNLRALVRAQDELESVMSHHQYAEIAAATFEQARDDILTQLYERIRDRFVELYSAIHGDDEEEFIAIIEPRGAGIDMEVDFYGRGSHPPHALHSEGHQDSMGICLYLALAEELTGELFQLIMLDDVVMSVDANHRRKVCTLLTAMAEQRQFVITTHEKAWANQLRSMNIVTSSGMVHFFDWSVEGGPTVVYEADIWGKIETDLTSDEVASAASALRRGSEHYFALIGSSIGASVRIRLGADWDLGELLPASYSRMRKLMRRAKAAAASWGKQKEHDEIDKADKRLIEAYQSTQAEQWFVNPAVHYNEWANFSVADFRPVVEAFHHLIDQFYCPDCGALLYVTRKDHEDASVRCNCETISWNLVTKDSS